jgi:hypothetical protein
MNTSSYTIARSEISACEDAELPLVLLTINEKGNLNIITNIPHTTDAVEAMCRLFDNAKQVLVERKGN